MASDSDLEAYLNQLSKKTHSLKQDVNTHGYASSRPTSAGDKSSDALNLSDEDDSVKRDSINTIGQGVFTSDITALSEKYSRPRYKKSQLYDEFSNLEKKYLKKATKKNALRRDSPEVVGQEIDHKSAKISDDEFRRHSRLTKAAHTKQNDTSCDSSVDDELARYLNESSLIDSHKEETEYRDVHIKSKSSSDGSVAESDVINFDNIMTVDDIMGQLSEEVEDDGSDHTEGKQSSSSNILENNHHSDLQNKKNKSSLLKNEVWDRRASVSKSKSLFEHEKEDSGGNKENIKNLFMKSSEGLFYPSTEVGVKDGNNDKMEGVLFTEVPDNIFHSSRRNSLMSPPIFRRKSSTKSLLSVSFHDLPDQNDSEDLTERSVAESVVENISSSHVSSVSEAITERNSSENVIAEYSEDFDATDDGKSSEKAVVKPKKNLMALPKTDVRKKEIISRKLSTDARRKSSADQSSPGTSYRSKHLKSEERESSLKASDKNNDNVVSRNVLDKEEKVHRKARERTKKSDSHFHRKSRKKSKKKPRHRSSSSSSSSTSSSSSSSSSSSRYSEKYRNAYRRHTRKKNKSKKHFFNPWISSPYMYPWWLSQIQQQQHSSPAAAENSFHHPDPRLMGGWIPSSSIVGVEDIMRQQVALTRQFMESHQALYHAYTSTLTSSYHYTSLKDTEKYIKKKKDPLTFDEAYRLVQEEMKDSKKEKKKHVKGNGSSFI